MKSSHNTSGKHKCLICDDISPSATLLAEHKLTHCKIGLSSECCYCQESLEDSASFKIHLRDHNSAEFPIQCICCRQTLNSDFEIGLHAKWVLFSLHSFFCILTESTIFFFFVPGFTPRNKNRLRRPVLCVSENYRKVRRTLKYVLTVRTVTIFARV